MDNYEDLLDIIDKINHNCKHNKPTFDIRVLVPSEERMQKYFEMWNKFDDKSYEADIEEAFDTEIVTVVDDIEHAPLIPNIRSKSMTAVIMNTLTSFIEVKNRSTRSAYTIDIGHIINDPLSSITKQEDTTDKQKETQINKIVSDAIRSIMTLPENESFGKAIELIKTESMQVLQNLETIVETLLSVEDESFIMFLADMGIISKKRCKERLAELKNNQAPDESKNAA